LFQTLSLPPHPQVVWTVNHVVGDAIAISFVGLCLGPFYPIIMNVLVATLPVGITGGAIGKSVSVSRLLRYPSDISALKAVSQPLVK
jgi:hypothetical protein